MEFSNIIGFFKKAWKVIVALSVIASLIGVIIPLINIPKQEIQPLPTPQETIKVVIEQPPVFVPQPPEPKEIPPIDTPKPVSSESEPFLPMEAPNLEEQPLINNERIRERFKERYKEEEDKFKEMYQ